MKFRCGDSPYRESLLFMNSRNRLLTYSSINTGFLQISDRVFVTL
jgi:hypothetical protein